MLSIPAYAEKPDREFIEAEMSKYIKWIETESKGKLGYKEDTPLPKVFYAPRELLNIQFYGLDVILTAQEKGSKAPQVEGIFHDLRPDK